MPIKISDREAQLRSMDNWIIRAALRPKKTGDVIDMSLIEAIEKEWFVQKL